MSNIYYEKESKLEVLVEGKSSRRIKAYDGKLMIVEVYFEDGYVSELHKHEHEQITYCLEGEFDFNLDGETKRVSAGDSIYFKPNIMHNCTVVSEKGRLLDIFTPIREDFIN